MAKTYPGRYAADIDGDFVVFLIGMRVTKPWRPTKWVPVSMAMQSMLKQLKADPEKGLLGAHLAIILGVGPSVVQYWRSYEDLNRFARDPAALHLPKWRWFNKKVGASGDVGMGTRPTASGPESTNACTATCRSSDSRPRPTTSPSRRRVSRRQSASGQRPRTTSRSPSTRPLHHRLTPTEESWLRL